MYFSSKQEIIDFIKNEYFKENSNSAKSEYANTQSLVSKMNKEALEELYNEYPWVNKNSFLELAYCIKNNIKDQPRCKICGEPIKFYDPHNMYPEFCSRKCAMEYNKNPIKYDKPVHEASEQDLIDFINQNCEIKELQDGTKIVNVPLKYKLFMNVDPALVAYVKKRWPWVKSIKEAIHCYVNNIYEQPRCIQCNKSTIFSGKKADYGYHPFCSNDCIQEYDTIVSQDKDKIKKFIETFYFQDNMTKTNRKLCNEKKMQDAGFIKIMKVVKKAASFAKDLTEAMYAYYYDITERPVCKRCGKEVRFVDVKNGYKNYCSIQCAKNSKPKPPTPELYTEEDIINFIKNEYFKSNGSPKNRWAKSVSIDKIIKNKDELNKLYSKYPWVNNFLELAYCIKNNITEQPRCPVCDQPVRFLRQIKSYNKFCSKDCANQFYTNTLENIKTPEHVDIDQLENKFKKFINEQIDIQPDGRVFIKNAKIIKFANLDNHILLFIKIKFPWVQNIREAVYCYLNNIDKQPKCKICKHPIFFSHIKGSYAYGSYCSLECLQADSDQKHLYSLSKNIQEQFFRFLELNRDKKLKNHTLNTLSTLLNVPKTILPRWLKQYNIETSDEPVYRSGLELSMEEYLKSLNIEFQTNICKILNGRELDFYIPEHNLAIEMHGKYWHSSEHLKERVANVKDYHYEKFKTALEKGIILFQIHDFQWQDPVKQKIWKSRIALHVNHPSIKKIHGRKCKIREVDHKTATEFLEISHLEGAINAKINLGLFYEEELVALMTFGKTRFGKNKEKEWELYRYASKLYTHVHGGASKLLKHFIKNYMQKGETLISFSNNDYSNGDLYKKLGFQFTGISESYFYIDQNNRIYNRMKVQKHKLPSLLGVDEKELKEKTAEEILYEHGIYKVHTSGQSKWVLTKK